MGLRGSGRVLKGLGMGTTHIQVELFQGPVVGLCHVLPGGRDVRLRCEQSAQPDVQCLHNRMYTSSSTESNYLRCPTHTHVTFLIHLKKKSKTTLAYCATHNAADFHSQPSVLWIRYWPPAVIYFAAA